MVGANIKFDLHWMMKQLPEFDIRKCQCIEDVEQLNQKGIPAVIIGKAIYENRITMDELKRFCD